MIERILCLKSVYIRGESVLDLETGMLEGIMLKGVCVRRETMLEPGQY